MGITSTVLHQVTICEAAPPPARHQRHSVDTGSSGLRIFGQANHLKLATETAFDGNPVAECVPFGTLSTWGRVAYVDVKLGGEPGDLESADSDHKQDATETVK